MEYSDQTLEEGLLSSDHSNGIGREAAAAASSNSGGQQENRIEGDDLEFLTVDKMLVKYVGEFGRAQLWHFALVCSALIPSSLYKMVIIFSDHVPEWRCVSQTGGLLFNGGQECTPSSSICEMDRSLWEWVGGKSATTVSEWDLICGNEYKSGLAGSIFFMGFLVAGGIWGNVSDSFLGRKGGFTLSLISTGTLGLLTSLAPNFWAYILIRFLTGVSCSGISQCAFVLATEVIGPSKRGRVGMSAFFFFSIGVMILPIFGYFSTSWRALYLTIALVTAAYCVIAFAVLHESPRWYLVKGRVEDAMVVLRSFAKRNGNTVPQDARLTLDEDKANTSGAEETLNKKESLVPEELPEQSPTGESNTDSRLTVQPTQSSKSTKSKGTLVDVFRCKETRRRMLIMICVWFSTALVYYGISLNVVNVGFNLYFSVFMNGLIETPALATAVALSGRLGRRSVLVGFMSLTGLSCLLGSLVVIGMPSGGVPPPAAGLQLHRVLNPLANFGSQRISSNGHFSAAGVNFIDSNIPSSNSFFDRAQQYSFRGAGSSGTVNLKVILRLVCGVVGLFGMTGTYNVLYMYTTELFPTVVRNAVLGVGVQAAGIGAVGGPALAVLGRMSPSLPYVVFGVLAVTGALLASRLPETLNQPLYDTIEGMERAHVIRKPLK